ncbi:MAG: hypothetical protein ACFB6S_07175 [Geminicoccaceae bacterium]
MTRWAKAFGAPPGENTAQTAAPAASQTKKPIVAVSVLELEGSALEQVLDTVREQSNQLDTQPLAITTLSTFSMFRDRNIAVEQVVDPVAARRIDPDLQWRQRQTAQFRHIGGTWRPLTVVSFGRPPPESALHALREAAGMAPASSPDTTAAVTGHVQKRGK